VRNGESVRVGVIRDVAPISQAREDFATLAALHAGGGGNNGAQQAARTRQARFARDIVAVIRAPSEESLPVEELAVVHAHAPARDGLQADTRPIVDLILQGKSIVHRGEGSRLSGVDEYVRTHGYDVFVG